MPVIEAAVVIASPPETVAEALLDPGNAVFWTTDLERFEVVSRVPGEVGSLARLHYRQGERTYVLEDRLEAMLPGEYFRSSVSGQGIRARVETWLTAAPDGTMLRVRWAGTSRNLLLRLVMNLNRAAIRRQTQAELDTFRDLVERHGAHFAPGG